MRGLEIKVSNFAALTDIKRLEKYFRSFDRNDFHDINGPGGPWLHSVAHMDDPSTGHGMEDLDSRRMPCGIPYPVPEFYAVPWQSPTMAIIHNL